MTPTYTFSLVLLLLSALNVQAGPSDTHNSTIVRRGIDSSVYDNLVRFTKFSSAAYLDQCPTPMGGTLVKQINNAQTDTQAFIARDDANKQIVASFRGSQQLTDFGTDMIALLVDFTGPGIAPGSSVHAGFNGAWQSISSDILSTMQSEHAANPSYTLISTGHSLGGAIASLAAVTMKANMPDANLMMYTFGQPRTGNKAYADYVESVVGTDKIFRAVHTSDGVPTMVPQALGYEHHGTQFWQNPDPPSAETTQQCSGHEDPTCSDSIPSTGINFQHVSYFNSNIGVGDDPANCGLPPSAAVNPIAGIFGGLFATSSNRRSNASSAAASRTGVLMPAVIAVGAAVVSAGLAVLI